MEETQMTQKHQNLQPQGIKTVDVRPELTLIQIQMLEQMLNWDMEYCYPYVEFDGIADKNTLKKEMRGLISKGFVKISRGGMNEDGEISGGTGFFLDHERRMEIEELVQEANP
jgi:hypothetical protein